MRLFARKLAALAAVLFGVVSLSFVLLRVLPASPAVAALGTAATKESIQQFNRQHGLDQPMLEQYGRYLWGALHGDLGRSYKTGQPVSEAIAQRLPVTVELLVLSQLLALVVAIPVGMLAAYRPTSAFDRISAAVVFGLLAAPTFVLAVPLVYVFAVRLRVLPATGFTPLTQDLAQNLRSVALPCIILALGEMAAYTRLLRADMIATMQADFVAAARAKGLSTRQILSRHVLRISSFSLVTVAGLSLATLIGGAVIVETIFAQPGVGDLTVRSIFARDYPLVQGTVLVIAAGYCLINFTVDALYTVIDPRVRDQTSRR